ncbi:hypothetical protein GALMADRAFT_390805 [Galerina marginata CBS 339.88]|uniref:Uncharacterized protein n=1 Tax=Galerina marginata (strain CBS 339.88) TaxID=685588 RepID=A0A067U392_GALM3|nr:hypothetical protein GALMADRAFT_390805 [Galerina marginata CBS 339.88]
MVVCVNITHYSCHALNTPFRVTIVLIIRKPTHQSNTQLLFKRSSSPCIIFNIDVLLCGRFLQSLALWGLLLAASPALAAVLDCVVCANA